MVSTVNHSLINNLFTGINHNIDELLVGVFTQISLKQGCPVKDQAKAMNKVATKNYFKDLRRQNTNDIKGKPCKTPVTKKLADCGNTLADCPAMSFVFVC